MRRNLLLLLPAVALLVAAGPAAAELTIMPSVGAMLPAKNLVMGTSSYVRMKDHTLYGLSLGKPLSDDIDVDLALSMGKGEIELVGTEVYSFGSTALLADLRARVGILGGGDSNLGVVLGAGWTDYKTGYFDFAEEINSGISFIGKLHGLVGLDLRAPVSDRMHLAVTMADRIHKSGLDATVVGTEGVEKTQHDLAATVGIRFPLD
jgi:hypothetical protein